jgi:hypothetical protein
MYYDVSVMVYWCMIWLVFSCLNWYCYFYFFPVVNLFYIVLHFFCKCRYSYQYNNLREIHSRQCLLFHVYSYDDVVFTRWNAFMSRGGIYFVYILLACTPVPCICTVTSKGNQNIHNVDNTLKLLQLISLQ